MLSIYAFVFLKYSGSRTKKRDMMTSVNLAMQIVFYSTNDIKERLRIKSTQTLKSYRNNKGFPNPVVSTNGAHDLYSVQAVHTWEQEQLNKFEA